jgi:predicted RecA/RadA family phage recombinase
VPGARQQLAGGIDGDVLTDGDGVDHGGSGGSSMPAVFVRFVHEGDAIDYTPGVDKTTGDVVVQADLVGVVKRDIKANKLGALAVTGVFDFPKATGAGSAIPAGTLTYWDAAAGAATKNAASGANKLLGKAVSATVDTDTIVRVRLQQ